MKKYIIRWNVGYGDEYDVVQAKNSDAAEQEAYKSWREEAEDKADFGHEEWTEELAEDYSLG